MVQTLQGWINNGIRYPCFSCLPQILKSIAKPLSIALLPELEEQRTMVIQLHREDSQACYARMLLPNALAEKYKRASKELLWQWLLPTQRLPLMPNSEEYCRFHMIETLVQKAILKEVLAKPNTQKSIGTFISAQFCQTSSANEL
jgi:hypothetical protein